MDRIVRISSCLLTLVAGLVACVDPTPPRFEGIEQESHTEARLQAVVAVNERIVWASGLDGTVTCTDDGGASWKTERVAGAEELQFRDVHAFDSDLVYLLSAGEGEKSRIYKTEDGGATWALQFLNLEPEGFLDCFDFWDPRRGVVYGDSVDGKLVVLTTSNGGATWTELPADALPAAGEGEGGFAASGTCVETGTDGRAWIGTGAGGNARVLRSEDWGRTWEAADSPIVRGDSAGIMSVLFLSRRFGLVLGGDLGQQEVRTANVAWSSDGGRSWKPRGGLRFPGAAYGGAVWKPASRREPPILLATGPGGLDVSVDQGASWHAVSDREYWSVDFGGPGVFWAVGPGGRITRFDRAKRSPGGSARP